jgi:HEAT repeat protein
MLAAIVAAAALIGRTGVVSWITSGLSAVLRRGIERGFQSWRRTLGWASWQEFLIIVCAILLLCGVAGGWWPVLRILGGLATLVMGSVSCLAYMFLDSERAQVERGHKVVYNPLKGQILAVNLARYGKQVGIPFLISAAIALIGGFAFLNQGFYQTIGKSWYQIAEAGRQPTYADFLVYSLAKVLGLVDVLDVAKSRHFLASAFIRPHAWPASTLLAGFKIFFTLVLLHQIMASLRRGKLLSETITDFWSPHEPIRERASGALPVYGIVAIGPLLESLRRVPSITKEQRRDIPLILETIGPSIIPALVRHLGDSSEGVRAIAAAALGHLHAVETVPALCFLAKDPSDLVRESVISALGSMGGGKNIPRSQDGSSSRRGARMLAVWRSVWTKERATILPLRDPVELAVEILESALSDPVPAVRGQAALALSKIGPVAESAVPSLIETLRDADERVRCQAADALGAIAVDDMTTANALVALLTDPKGAVKIAAARALGVQQTAATLAITALRPLLQDEEEAVRTTAAEAIARFGHLDHAASDVLSEALGNQDSVVRAQTAEALGTIGAAALHTVPALVKATTDSNDRVRAKAVEALGKIGENGAAESVPGLVRALRDRDNWVSALAAEALGQIGDSADGAIPALVRSLTHNNAEVRRNSAEALGRMSSTAAVARPSIETATHDTDGGVRAQAIRALGSIGAPTPTSTSAIMAGLKDIDPRVRAAAVEAIGQWGEPTPLVVATVLELLDDADDLVKVQVTKVLPKLAGPTPEVIDGLRRRLVEDSSDWVQVYAALALGRIGPPAATAGPALLHAAQTGDVSVREQAMRAIATIQPPETTVALAAGLHDVSNDIRRIASAAWINAANIPDEAVPSLIEGLRDPEAQVRANCAHALARLDGIPAAAIPLLIECTADASDALRLNAAQALRLAPAPAVVEVMRNLVADPNSRVRLIAASAILSAEPDNIQAGAVLIESLGDPALGVRESALSLLESLGEAGVTLLEVIKAGNAPNGSRSSAV